MNRKTILMVLALGIAIFIDFPTAMAQQQYVFPKNGQSPDKQNKDEYDCHLWAVQQTHFDPTLSAQAPPQEQQPAGAQPGSGARGAAKGARLGRWQVRWAVRPARALQSVPLPELSAAGFRAVGSRGSSRPNNSRKHPRSRPQNSRSISRPGQPALKPKAIQSSNDAKTATINSIFNYKEKLMVRVQKTVVQGMALMLVISLLYGCASTGTPTTAKTAERSGFLSNYELLKPIDGGDGAQSWRSQDVDWKKYDKVLIERIQVFIKTDSENKGIDPTDLKMLTDYFYQALVKEIEPAAKIVDTPGPDDRTAYRHCQSCADKIRTQYRRHSDPLCVCC